MKAYINIKLYATIKRFLPNQNDKYPITPGITIENLLAGLGVPKKHVKLIFINGKRGEMTSTLGGGERVGIFPPVGGG